MGKVEAGRNGKERKVGGGEERKKGGKKGREEKEGRRERGRNFKYLKCELCI